MLLIFQARTFTYMMPLNYNCKTCQQDVHQKTNNLFNLRLCSNGHNRVSIQHCHLQKKKEKNIHNNVFDCRKYMSIFELYNDYHYGPYL